MTSVAGGALDAHGEVAGDEEECAEGDRLARAEPFVGDEAADQRQEIDEGGVGAVLAVAEFVVEEELLGSGRR